MGKRDIAILAMVAGALFAAPAMAQVAPAATIVSLNAEAETRAVPDVADIGAGVVTRAADASAALTANAAQMNRVVAELRRAGIADRDIQTARISLQPQYRHEKEKEPQLVGYEAHNRVSVTLRDIGNAGKVIDALVAQGANQIDGPNFRVDKPEPLLDKARAEAVKNGRARAELYAAAAGMRVRRILSIEEAGTPRPPMPMPRMMAMAADAYESSPVAPGEVGLNVRVTMRFELE